MVKALLVNTDAPVELIDLNGYKDTKSRVGGNIEGLLVSKHMYAYLNEEGKFLCPMNWRATKICTALKTGLHPLDNIHGPMLLMGPTGSEGEDTDITLEGLESLKGIDGIEVDSIIKTFATKPSEVSDEKSFVLGVAIAQFEKMEKANQKLKEEVVRLEKLVEHAFKEGYIGCGCPMSFREHRSSGEAWENSYSKEEVSYEKQNVTNIGETNVRSN